MPPGVTIWTHTEPVRGLVCPFDPAIFSDADADGTPYMSTHGIWLGNEFVGRVFRLYAHTPWSYGLRGSLVDRTGGDDFNACVVALLRWRDRYIADLEDMFSDSRSLNDWIERAKADDRAERSAQLARAKADEAKAIKQRQKKA